MKRPLIGLLVIGILALLGYLFISQNVILAGESGSIERYNFSMTEAQLATAIDQTIAEHPAIQEIDGGEYLDFIVAQKPSADTILYEDFRAIYNKYDYVAIQVNQQRYIFRIKTDALSDSESRIILFSAALYGEGLGPAKKMTAIEKRLHAQFFKAHFIDLVQES